MRQRGQILRLKASGADGRPLWAYRYRDGGRGSKRVQRGGFASEQDAREALEHALETLRRAQRAASLPTFAELVREYLAQHDASVRAVPLQAIALGALDQSPSSPQTALLFPAAQGGYFDLHNFRTRYWKPAQIAAGIRPLRRVTISATPSPPSPSVPASPPSTSPATWAPA